MVVGSQLVCNSFVVGFSEQMYLNRIRSYDDAVEMLFNEVALDRDCGLATVASLARELAQRLDYKAFYFGCRHARDAASLVGPLLQNRMRDIVPVPRAVFVRVGRGYPFAAVIEDAAREDGRRAFRLTPSPNGGGRRASPARPRTRLDLRWASCSPSMDLAAIDDFADVERGCAGDGEGTDPEPDPAPDPAIADLLAPGPIPVAVEILARAPIDAEFEIPPEDHADGFGLVGTTTSFLLTLA